jgi:hypothetical protein
MDTASELAIQRELYGCFTAYKNFFQPTMNLVEKAGGRKNPSQVRSAQAAIPAPDRVGPDLRYSAKGADDAV